MSISRTLLVSSMLSLVPAAGFACTPTLVVLDARVHTVDGKRPAAEAVAVCNETIVRVGTTAEVRALAGPGTRVVNARGRLLVPGFNDAHVHLIHGADQIVGIDLRSAASEGDMAQRLRAHASGLPKGRWITGGYWDHERWPSKALPTRYQLDAATPDHPVFVQRLDGHMAVANSLAMQLAGVSRDATDPEGGTIVRLPDGEPSGVFKDNAMSLVSRAIPPIRSTRRSQRRARR